MCECSEQDECCGQCRTVSADAGLSPIVASRLEPEAGSPRDRAKNAAAAELHELRVTIELMRQRIADLETQLAMRNAKD